MDHRRTPYFHCGLRLFADIFKRADSSTAYGWSADTAPGEEVPHTVASNQMNHPALYIHDLLGAELRQCPLELCRSRYANIGRAVT